MTTKKIMTIKKMLISYFPLVNVDNLTPGETVDANDLDAMSDIYDRISSEHSGRAKGVIWLHYPLDEETDVESAVPMSIMDRAKEIADHLTKWSEDQIAKRFDLYFDDRPEGYAIALIPNIDESIRRWKLARLIYHEDAVDDNDFQVIFSPLSVICPKGDTYNKIKGFVKNPTQIGFVDTKDAENLEDIDSDMIHMVGAVNIRPSCDISTQIIDNLFEELVEDEE